MVATGPNAEKVVQVSKDVEHSCEQTTPHRTLRHATRHNGQGLPGSRQHLWEAPPKHLPETPPEHPPPARSDPRKLTTSHAAAR